MYTFFDRISSGLNLNEKFQIFSIYYLKMYKDKTYKSMFFMKNLNLLLFNGLK